MGLCLLIKSDCREFVKAEVCAHRHNAGDSRVPRQNLLPVTLLWAGLLGLS